MDIKKLEQEAKMKIRPFRMPGGEMLYFVKNTGGYLLNEGQSLDHDELLAFVEGRKENQWAK